MSDFPGKSPFIRSVFGRIFSLDLQQRMLLLDDQGDLRLYLLAEDVRVYDCMQQSDLSRLQVGQEVQVIYEITERGPIALALHLTAANE